MKSHDFNDPPFERQISEQFERSGDWLKRSLPKIAPIAVGVITLLWLASGVYMVGPGHVGVVRTFGKETARTEPGLNYRFPWPIQQADVVSLEQVRRVEGEEEANKLRAQTDKERTIVLAEAEQNAQMLRGEGDATATRIYAGAYGKDPEFYSFVRSLQSYELFLGKRSRLLLSADSPLFRYLGGPRPEARGRRIALGQAISFRAMRRDRNH